MFGARVAVRGRIPRGAAGGRTRRGGRGGGGKETKTTSGGVGPSTLASVVQTWVGGFGVGWSAPLDETVGVVVDVLVCGGGGGCVWWWWMCGRVPMIDLVVR